VPSPINGTIAEILFKEDDVVEIGTVIAIIATEVEDGVVQPKPSPAVKETNGEEFQKLSNNGQSNGSAKEEQEKRVPAPASVQQSVASSVETGTAEGTRFYSPLVRNIAKKESISIQELEKVPGTGAKGRVTKHDILSYLENRTTQPQTEARSTTTSSPVQKSEPSTSISKTSGKEDSNVEIIEMDRMRRLIADHMVNSKHTSPHVTSFVEVDVTDIVNWREKNKKAFQEKYGEKITFTPIFIEAVVKAINDFPLVNISVDGNTIIRKKNINIGMAAALPSGNLIVPVIKNADHLNLLGLAKKVNDLAGRARNNKLKPEEIQDGTFTITNVGTFGNLMGTPIINQPQAAILATGAIRKKPAVVETEYGDMIAVRQMMFLSLSYDHRVVDGALGGSFLRRIGDYLEQFDSNQKI
jgi:2-oxoglutarate dehydrogenase E2 component (dihydrolipoamide succinyltransferase)